MPPSDKCGAAKHKASRQEDDLKHTGAQCRQSQDALHVQAHAAMRAARLRACAAAALRRRRRRRLLARCATAGPPPTAPRHTSGSESDYRLNRKALRACAMDLDCWISIVSASSALSVSVGVDEEERPLHMWGMSVQSASCLTRECLHSRQNPPSSPRRPARRRGAVGDAKARPRARRRVRARRRRPLLRRRPRPRARARCRQLPRSRAPRRPRLSRRRRRRHRRHRAPRQQLRRALPHQQLLRRALQRGRAGGQQRARGATGAQRKGQKSGRNARLARAARALPSEHGHALRVPVRVPAPAAEAEAGAAPAPAPASAPASSAAAERGDARAERSRVTEDAGRRGRGARALPREESRTHLAGGGGLLRSQRQHQRREQTRRARRQKASTTATRGKTSSCQILRKKAEQAPSFKAPPCVANNVSYTRMF